MVNQWFPTYRVSCLQSLKYSDVHTTRVVLNVFTETDFKMDHKKLD